MPTSPLRVNVPSIDRRRFLTVSGGAIILAGCGAKATNQTAASPSTISSSDAAVATAEAARTTSGARVMPKLQDLTQAPVASGEDFTYRFALSHPGTYWYHPHMGLQLDRALYAPLIIEDPNEPIAYDTEHTLIIDDWLDGIGGTPEDAYARLTCTSDMGGMSDGMDMSGMGGSSNGTAPSGMAMFHSDALGGMPEM